MTRFRMYTSLAALPITILLYFIVSADSFAAQKPAFAGSASCAQCHEKEYATFQQHSKKAQSWKSVAIMAPKLTQEELQGCYACHTTGYGQGGFVDYATSPQFADVGCETCHGPGAAHAESGDPALITRKPSEKTCQTCHDAKRIRSFKRDPLMYSGAH